MSLVTPNTNTLNVNNEVTQQQKQQQQQQQQQSTLTVTVIVLRPASVESCAPMQRDKSRRFGSATSTCH
ncbi:GH21075 [Drosophila grimshawi]|uniref:GH21075 n=1 Tax=Drosophila grimshawi TaxID=7222 RepID=B4JRM8_DROGR|nr:GH21075 [Drosophila grimshawi]